MKMPSVSAGVWLVTEARLGELQKHWETPRKANASGSRWGGVYVDA